MAGKKLGDRIIGIYYLAKENKWRVRYVLNGRTHNETNDSEEYIRQRAVAIQRQIDGTNEEKAKGETSRATKKFGDGGPDDWRKLIWHYTARVAVRPDDLSAQSALRAICQAANATKSIGKQDDNSTPDNLSALPVEKLVEFTVEQLLQQTSAEELISIIHKKSSGGEVLACQI